MAEDIALRWMSLDLTDDKLALVSGTKPLPELMFLLYFTYK